MRHQVVFSPESEEQLSSLYAYIAAAASTAVAARYTEAIVSYCEGLCDSPLRGTVRDDVRPGLRIVDYKKRCVIAYAVDEVQVASIGVFDGGQDFQALLDNDLDDATTH